MRRSLLWAIVLLASPAVAQEPVPDSVDWRRYAPLAVGNAWQYAVDEQDLGWPIYHRRYVAAEIVGEVVINDTAYFEVELCERADDEPTTCAGPEEITLVRYDGATASLTAPAGAYSSEPWSWYPCGLDAPFRNGGEPHIVPCPDGREDYQDGVYGEYHTEYTVLGEIVTGSLTRKSFETLVSGAHLLTDVGLLSAGAGDPDCSQCISLVYARLNGVEYGAPVLTVASEPGPEPVEPALVVAPNPLRETADLRFALDAPQRLTLEVHDVRGRRVQTVELGARGAGEGHARFEAAGLPPGAYLLRLRGDAGFEATRGVIVAR